MVQKLVQHGDRLALVLDNETIAAMNVTADTPLHVVVHGRALVVARASEDVPDAELDEMLETVNRDFGGALKRLAE